MSETTQQQIDAAARFAGKWEKAQGAIGRILRAYYYGTRPEYVRAIYEAAHALADMECLASPRHTEASTPSAQVAATVGGQP